MSTGEDKIWWGMKYLDRVISNNFYYIQGIELGGICPFKFEGTDKKQ